MLAIRVPWPAGTLAAGILLNNELPMSLLTGNSCNHHSYDGGAVGLHRFHIIVCLSFSSAASSEVARHFFVGRRKFLLKLRSLHCGDK